MTDIFFSYSSKDRDLVRPVRDALAGLGFDVFWDQAVPPGVDWDTWIRGHLNRSKCAVVFWSPNAVASANVRHEATVAKQQGKLLPVLLKTLTADQFPMGLYVDQAVDLVDWSGDERHDEWRKLQNVVEEKLKPHAPLWLQRTIDSLDADLTAERARVRSTENRVRTLHDRIAQDANAGLDRERERDAAVEELAILKARLTEAAAARANLSAKAEALTRQIGVVEGARKELAERLAMVESLNVDTNTARTGAEGQIAKLAETVGRLEAERDAQIARRHELEARTRDLSGAQPSSRGHVGWLDLIVLAGIGGWLLLFATGTTWPSGIPTGARDYVGITGVAALVWALVIAVRMSIRRRVRPSAILAGKVASSIAPNPPPVDELSSAPAVAPGFVNIATVDLVASGLAALSAAIIYLSISRSNTQVSWFSASVLAFAGALICSVRLRAATNQIGTPGRRIAAQAFIGIACGSVAAVIVRIASS